MEENPNPSPEGGPQPNSNMTSLGIEENVAGLLTYLLGWVTGIIFLLIEKENSFVRFHAMQLIVVFVPLVILSWVLGALPFIGGFLGFTAGGITFVLWLFLMYQAFQGKRYKLPYAGAFAEKQLTNKGSS